MASRNPLTLFKSFTAFVTILKPSVLSQEVLFLIKDPSIQGLMGLIGVLLALVTMPFQILLKILIIVLITVAIMLLVEQAITKRTSKSIYATIEGGASNQSKVLYYHSRGREKGGLYDWKKSLEFYQKALNLGVIPDTADLYGIILHDIGQTYVWPGRKKEAFEKLEESFYIYSQSNTTFIKEIGSARVNVARMNAYVYFGDFSCSFDNPGMAEKDFLTGVSICASDDPIIKNLDNAYTVNFSLQALPTFDAYGASKAHCQYAWALLENNSVNSLWHAKAAYEYSKEIKDSQFNTFWGLRDGAIGSTWRESISLFTIADCYTLLDRINEASDYYNQSERKILFADRKWYFQGHYFWLFLCNEE